MANRLSPIRKTYEGNLCSNVMDKPGKAPIAMALAIEGIRRGLNWNWDEYMQFHARAITFCLNSEDHLEGARAFTEKRQPVFKGK